MQLASQPAQRSPPRKSRAQTPGPESHDQWRLRLEKEAVTHLRKMDKERALAQQVHLPDPGSYQTFSVPQSSASGPQQQEVGQPIGLASGLGLASQEPAASSKAALAAQEKALKAQAKEEANKVKEAAKELKAQKKEADRSDRLRKDRSKCCWKFVASVPSWCKLGKFPLLVLAALAMLRGSTSTLDHVAQAVGATAAISVAFSGLAVQVLNSTSSGMAFASSMMWGVTSTSLGTLESSWRGIDLVNVSISKSKGHLLAPHPVLLGKWLRSPAGSRTTLCNSSHALTLWTDAVHSLIAGIPSLHHVRDKLLLSGAFSRVAVQMNWTGPDEVIMYYECVEASFSPRWANPLWGWIELEWESESAQITSLLHQLLAQMPAARIVHLQLDEADVELAKHELWQVRVAQAVRASQVMLRLFNLALAGLLDRLSRGWGLVFSGVIFTVSFSAGSASGVLALSLTFEVQVCQADLRPGYGYYYERSGLLSQPFLAPFHESSIHTSDGQYLALPLQMHTQNQS